MCERYNQSPSLFFHPTQSSFIGSLNNSTLGFILQASSCQGRVRGCGASFLESLATLFAGVGGPYRGLALRDIVNSTEIIFKQ